MSSVGGMDLRRQVMQRLFRELMLLSALLNLLSTAQASPECSLAWFAGDYIQAYRSQGTIDDCYHQILDDMDKARSVQADLVALLAEDNQRAGYKVGLTDRKAQEMFGIHQPLVGVLFEKMLLPDSARIALDSATSLLVELDLLAQVKSAEINQAESVEEVARHINTIIPFIELPDAMFRRGESRNAAALLLAGNVGARWGVIGVPVTVVDAQDLIELLPSMKFRLSTGTGEVLREGRGGRIPGHPLNSVLFLLKELHLRNETLKQGDMISLGAIGGPVKAERGRSYTAEYSGYTGQAFMVSVTIQ